MKRKSTSLFTLVEILIAMGVCVIGVCSIMVLFPIGATASRDAAMVGYAANAADQMLHFAKDCIMQEGAGGVAAGRSDHRWHECLGHRGRELEVPPRGITGGMPCGPVLLGRPFFWGGTKRRSDEATK